MPQQDPSTPFDRKHAAEYDQRFAKAAAMPDALQLLTAAVLSDLPADARVLCAGAGTGLEIAYLVQRFSGLAVRGRRAIRPDARRVPEEDRRVWHQRAVRVPRGYLDSLPLSEPFDAATWLLVSLFVFDPVLPQQPPVGRQLDQAVGALAVLGQRDPVPDRSTRPTRKRRKRQQHRPP
jgi:tRNA (cmo5U34)-methyltransferase